MHREANFEPQNALNIQVDKILHLEKKLEKSQNLFSTMGTDTAGFRWRPSMMSWALSPYILWIAFRWMTSEEPPIVLSNLKRSCSSADMRESFRCTVSRARIVARLDSRTTSS